MILEIIQNLSLALIAGGTICLGALVAPTLFNELSRIEAGLSMKSIFDKFAQWTEVAALALFISKLCELIFIRGFNFNKEMIFMNQTKITSNFDYGFFFDLVLVLAIFVVSLYLSLELMPKMMNAYEDDEKLFQELHKKSEKVFKVNFLLAVLALIF